MLSTPQFSDKDREGDSHLDSDHNTKKVRFKENVVVDDNSMAVDPDQQPFMSWKDKLLGSHGAGSVSISAATSVGNDSDFELLEEDVNKSIINGIPAIKFSDRIKEILFKEMESTIIVKLLGRNIGYNALQNRILFLWKPLGFAYLTYKDIFINGKSLAPSEALSEKWSN
ncbi:hypothetical protein J1N35_020878 [Gossypium stocksii]|uniref:DUF4283 domain-containing protein n=1 Tax=Gossypium stocksii TaxID=47602 RepID=A0A9D3VFF6_9ROSI|nr:hypothetical protein J1N35_020878 [Gossypium stocksii]